MQNSISLKSYVIVLLLLVVSNSVFAQSNQWVKQYPLAGCNTGITSNNGAVEAYDKGFYMAGMDGCLPNDIRLYKTDVNGNILWQRVIGQVKQEPVLGGITATADGGVAISGAIYKTANTNDLFLIKLNPCGAMEWCKIYDLNQYSTGGGAIELKNGDFIVHSNVYVQRDTIGNYYNSLTFCTDALGNLKWQEFDNQFAGPALIDNSQNVLTIGSVYRIDTTTQPAGPIRCELNKISPTGTKLWSSVYGLPQGIFSNNNQGIYSQGVACVQTNDGGYLALVAQLLIDSSIYTQALVKYNVAGEIQWGKLISDTTVEEDPQDMAAVNDSTFICFSMTGNNFWLGNIKFSKVTDKGQILKQFTYKNTGELMGFSNIKPTSDGKFTVAGVLGSNILVIKLNSNLELDTFYSNDTNKYDYLCSHPVASMGNISFSKDTVPITITFPPIPPTTINPGKFAIYPNPYGGGAINVLCPIANAPATITMYDMLGRLINKYNFTPGNFGQSQINPGSPASGCYVIILEQNGERYVQKLVVE